MALTNGKQASNPRREPACNTRYKKGERKKWELKQ